VKSLDIAICGCGPAGLAAALLLVRAGHRVRMFERFETPRPVGSGLILQPTGLGVLEELGLGAEMAALGARIDRLFGRVRPANRVVLDVRYEKLGHGRHGVAVQRSALFGVLYGAVQADGVQITPGIEVAGIEQGGSRPQLLARSGVRLGSFDLVVDALGARSPLSAARARRIVLPYGALWANVPWPANGTFSPNALEQRYFRASRMAGILPVGRAEAGSPPAAAFFWSLRRDRFESWRNSSIPDWKREVAELWPEAAVAIENIVDHPQLIFATYEHFTLRSPLEGRLVHIGDAAHSTSPQLGQGGNMALLDALALGRAMAVEGEISQRLREYARMRSWHVRLFQAASAMFTPFYQSDSRVLPAVRDWLAAPLSRLPIGSALLARLVAGMTVPPLGRSR
jgi:2-polyprenyl-6-methoxyphenol hydroxylase-like FAD-dependent oxidoreductase